MKIKVSAKQASSLTELRSQLAAALAGILKANSALERATNRQNELQTEIAELERTANPSDQAAIRELSDKRGELDLIGRQLHDMQPPSPAHIDEITALARAADRAAENIMEPFVTEYAATIAGKFRPYCISDAHALHLARQTQAVIALSGAACRAFGRYHFAAPNTKAQLAHIDTILSGELAWTFDSKQ